MLHTGWTSTTGLGSRSLPSCSSVCTTWRLDMCRHSANSRPAFLVADASDQPTTMNWTTPVSILPYTGVGSGVRLRRFYNLKHWGLLLGDPKSIHFSLSTFKRHPKTFFISYYHTHCYYFPVFDPQRASPGYRRLLDKILHFLPSNFLEVNS